MKRLQYCKDLLKILVIFLVSLFLLLEVDLYPLLNPLIFCGCPLYCLWVFITSSYQRIEDIGGDNGDLVFAIFLFLTVLFPIAVLYPMLAPSGEE